MRTIKKIIKILIIAALIIGIITIIILKYNLLNNNEPEIIEEEKIEIKKEETEPKEKIYVDIKGAVTIPGVYELDKESRVIDLVKLSGGLTEEADTTYINLAKKLKDEMVVIIYTKDQIKKAKEKETLAIKEVNNTCICPKITNDSCITKENTNTETKNETKEEKETTSTKININTATKEELQTLTGIGASKAEAIIEYRKKNGNFNTIEDIKNVSGIGEAAYEKIKDYITV